MRYKTSRVFLAEAGLVSAFLGSQTRTCCSLFYSLSLEVDSSVRHFLVHLPSGEKSFCFRASADGSNALVS